MTNLNQSSQAASRPDRGRIGGLTKRRAFWLLAGLALFLIGGLAWLALLPVSRVPSSLRGLKSTVIQIAKENGAARKYGPRLSAWLFAAGPSYSKPQPVTGKAASQVSGPAPASSLEALRAAVESGDYRRPFDVYWNWARAGSAHVLDRAPDAWLPPEVDAPFVRDDAPLFTPDGMPEPTAADIAQWKAETPLVRRMPYPYAQGLNVASDSCATLPADYYYTGALLSRRYGLDLGSSFFAHTSSKSFFVPALFSGRSYRPASAEVTVEDKTVNWWPLFLSLYSRGWVDHLHSWSNGALPDVTVVYPLELALPKDGLTETSLDWQGYNYFEWVGLALDLKLDERIEAFEIEIREEVSGLSHWITSGRPLAGRPGWEVARDRFKNKDQAERVFIMLDDEDNPKAQSLLGEAGDHKITARLALYGPQGAQAALKSLSLVDIKASLAESQAETMRGYNILPFTSTWHGGVNAWGSIEKSGNVEYTSDFGPAKGRLTTTIPRDYPYGDSPDSTFNMGKAYERVTTLFQGAADTVGTSSSGSPLNYVPLYGNKTYCDPNLDLAGDKSPTPFSAYWETIGSSLARYLSGRGIAKSQYGACQVFYNHFNLFTAALFDLGVPPSEIGPYRSMHQIKRLTANMRYAFNLLSELKYNLSGARKWHQRVWAAPFPVLMRHQETLRELPGRVSLTANTVEVTPWRNALSGQVTPDPVFAAQDLHGQTFYVPDPAQARVTVDGRELTALKRNPPDFTGRPSVTVVDDSFPTRVFDELEPSESNTLVFQDGASGYFVGAGAYSGQYTLEIQAEKAGPAGVDLKPFALHSHETDFIRFAYRKTNPQAEVELGWGPGDTAEFIVTEGELDGRAGWRIPRRLDTEWHEVVLEYADMAAPAGRAKAIPRGVVSTFRLGLQKARPGDSVFFDKVDFLSARGNRPQTGGGLMIGGQIDPPRDYEAVTLKAGGKVYTTHTERGGWYLFTQIPAGAVAEIVYERERVKYFPLRGRLLEVVRNDMEYHIKAVDQRNPSMPRPGGFTGLDKPFAVPLLMGGDNGDYGFGSKKHGRWSYGGLGPKFEYIAGGMTNNQGVIDRDRSLENRDRAIRILLQGGCWIEGQQMPNPSHVNLILESILRRRTGVPVEVPVTAWSSSSLASWSLAFRQYGRQLKPDLVILENSPGTMLHLEPGLLRQYIGWDAENPPYTMYDFGPDGRLLEYPPNKAEYNAFAVAADIKPLMGEVPMEATYSALAVPPPIIGRSFALMWAILDQEYLRPLAESGAGRLALMFGHNVPPPYGARYGGISLDYGVWRAAMREQCEKAGVIPLDVADSWQSEDKGQTQWEADSHLTPTGHYKLAEALADRIMALPYFQQLVAERQAQSPRPAPAPAL